MRQNAVAGEEGSITLLRPLPLRVLVTRELPLRFRSSLIAVFLVFTAASIFLGILSRRCGFDAVRIATVHNIPIYFTLYPPIILSGVLTFWFGLGWGVAAAYISTFVVSVDAGISIFPALIFSFANPVGLFVLHTFASAFRAEPDLSDFRSKGIFTASALLGASASSSAAFLWALRSGGETSMFFPLWEGWFLNNALYFVLIVGPILGMTGRRVALWKESQARDLIIEEVRPSRITTCLIVSLLVPILIAFCLGFGVERQLKVLRSFRANGAIENIYNQLQYNKSAQDILLVIVGILGCMGIYFFSLLFLQIIQVRKKLSKQSVTDSLTGLRNRRFAEEQLDAQFQRYGRYKTPYSLIILDIDRFKSVNDEYGHPAGDKTLQEVARYAVENTREVDVRARYGGEEFLIILPDTEIAGARTLAERLRRYLEEHPVKWNGITITVTASFGTAEMAPDDDGPYRAVSRADEALYLSKKAGRNRVT